MKVEVAVLGSPVPNGHYGLCGRKATLNLFHRAQGLRESRSCRLGLPVPNSLYGLCGRRATLNLNLTNGAFQVTQFRCDQEGDQEPI